MEPPYPNRFGRKITGLHSECWNQRTLDQSALPNHRERRRLAFRSVFHLLRSARFQCINSPVTCKVG